MSGREDVAILVENVHKRYGRHAVPALDAASFTVPWGSITALIGPNGAGKSTVLHAIVGLVRPDRGRIALRGGPPDDPESRAGVGFVPEDVAIEAGVTARTFLRAQARFAGVDPVREVSRVLELAGVTERAHVRLDRCSHGTLRRVVLAAAFLGEPEVLVLDEPTSGMDVPSRDRLMDTLRELRDKGGAVLISSHVLAEVEAIADRIVLLRRGSAASEGPLNRFRDCSVARVVLDGISREVAVALAGDAWLVRDAAGGVFELEGDAADADRLVGSALEARARIVSLARGDSLGTAYRREADA